MKNKIICILLLAVGLIACNNSPPPLSSKLSPSPVVPLKPREEPKPLETPQVPDLHRQDNIHEDFNRDNFDFTQFKGIDWRDVKSFGEPCSGSCVGPTKNPIPEHLVFKELGVTSDNYYTVSIKGDGSCWIRSAIQALLFTAFQDQKIFDAMLVSIVKAATKYQSIPGFCGRFYSQNLINLLTTLKSLSPKERLAQFNKSKVDLFLDYSMRALLHADSHLTFINPANDEKGKLAAKVQRQEKLKNYLTSHSWSDASWDFRVLARIFFPDDLITTSFGDVIPGGTDPQFIFSAKNDFGGFELMDEKIVALNDVIKNDKRTLAQVKKDCPLENEEEACLNALFIKTLEAKWGIKSLGDMHRQPAFRVFPMAQSDNHYAVMVHKNAAAAFGY